MWRRMCYWTKCWAAGWMKCCWTGTRTLVRCFGYGGMSVTEIAAVHDVNKSTVSRSVNRAKKTLQDYLQFCL